jgi:hypothetical protein
MASGLRHLVISVGLRGNNADVRTREFRAYLRRTSSIDRNVETFRAHWPEDNSSGNAGLALTARPNSFVSDVVLDVSLPAVSGQINLFAAHSRSRKVPSGRSYRCLILSFDGLRVGHSRKKATRGAGVGKSNQKVEQTCCTVWSYEPGGQRIQHCAAGHAGAIRSSSTNDCYGGAPEYQDRRRTFQIRQHVCNVIPGMLVRHLLTSNLNQAQSNVIPPAMCNAFVTAWIGTSASFRTDCFGPNVGELSGA